MLREAVAAARGFASAEPVHALAASQLPRLALQTAVICHPSQKNLIKRQKELVPADVVPSN